MFHRSPMYVFEVGIGILDVSWAPYSSTIFAASTDDGKVWKEKTPNLLWREVTHGRVL